MSSLEKQAWLGSKKSKNWKFTVRPPFREDIVVGSYVKVAYQEDGVCRGRISYKGDIHAAVAAERIVTIYFPDTDDFYDLNMWGNDGKMIKKYTPLQNEEFEIPFDPVNNPNPDQVEDAAAGGGGEEGEVGEVAEPENDIEEVAEPENAIEEVAEPEKKKRKKRRSLYTHKKKRRVNKE